MGTAPTELGGITESRRNFPVILAKPLMIHCRGPSENPHSSPTRRIGNVEAQIGLQICEISFADWETVSSHRVINLEPTHFTNTYE